MSLLRRAGLPNRDLLSTLEVAETWSPVGGAVHFRLTIPNVPAFAGIRLFHQFVRIEVGARGLASVSSSNGIALTRGMA
ncbi:MAG: hypothetical protein IPM29_16830 [Planctomycetes bacterium]|nr:hypothetical protein [Planctomycetota bacterium]